MMSNNDDSPVPSKLSGPWWEKLRLLAREMRHNPTPAEKVLWQHLRDHQVSGRQFRRQHAINRFIVDFYCAEACLVIEVDGPIHDYTPEDDAIRQEFLESLGLQVIRFSNDEVLAQTESVIERIRAVVDQRFTPNGLD